MDKFQAQVKNVVDKQGVVLNAATVDIARLKLEIFASKIRLRESREAFNQLREAYFALAKKVYGDEYDENAMNVPELSLIQIQSPSQQNQIQGQQSGVQPMQQIQGGMPRMGGGRPRDSQDAINRLNAFSNRALNGGRPLPPM